MARTNVRVRTKVRTKAMTTVRARTKVRAMTTVRAIVEKSKDPDVCLPLIEFFYEQHCNIECTVCNVVRPESMP